MTTGHRAIITLCVIAQHADETQLHEAARAMRDAAALNLAAAGAWAKRGIALDVNTSPESEIEANERIEHAARELAESTPAAAPLVNAVFRDDAATVRAIVEQLDGQTWSPDTLDRIAGLLRLDGHQIGEPAELDADDLAADAARAVVAAVDAKHAETYPDGCPLMCEACTARLAALERDRLAPLDARD